MTKINQHYNALEDNYLFATISQRVAEFTAQNPGAPVIRMGIGDVTLPLCPAVIDALHQGVEEMGHAETFKGYGPYEGYPFLRQAIAGYYGEMGVALSPDEVYVSEGAKSDVANILDLFAGDNTVLIPDPVYPVYLDTNLMAGREVVFLDANQQNGFLPLPDRSVDADLIYLCSPNNPTGAVYSHEALKAWVDYANEKGAVILFDAAYESFIQDPALPRSILQIPGARSCAIEFCSLSKTAGFTGTRCGYTVIPKELSREGRSLGELWLRRQSTKYNGVSYVIQKGAAAVFSPEGRAQTRAGVAHYMKNARVIADTMKALGIWHVGGENSPYIWLRCPGGMDSWDYFDKLLREYHIVGTPGSGFGKNGRGFFRLTAFGSAESTLEAMERLRK